MAPPSEKPKIVVIDGYTINPGDNPWDELSEIGELTVYERSSPAEVTERCREADIVLTNKVPLTAETINSLSRLRYIGVTATGYDMVDLEAARSGDIAITNVPVYGTNSVAQYVFALLLELCHHVGLHSSAVFEGEWARSVDFAFWKKPTMELDGKSMSIIGFGRIGRRVGELAHAFGMEVLAHDIRQAEPPGYSPFDWVTLDEAFSTGDVVSLNCTLTPENRKMVNTSRLSNMKKTAFLINAARGGLINERELSSALNSGQIAGAAVDVVSVEPIRADNPLLGAKNCIITPHIAWASLESRQRLKQSCIDNVRAYLNGEHVNRII